MNLNDQLHLYSIFGIKTFPLKPRDGKSPIHGVNERYPDIGELQRPLAVAPTDTDTLRGENHTVIDSAPIPTSALAFSANSRSPPVGSLGITSRMARMQFSASELHTKKNNLGGTNG